MGNAIQGRFPFLPNRLSLSAGPHNEAHCKRMWIQGICTRKHDGEAVQNHTQDCATNSPYEE